MQGMTANKWTWYLSLTPNTIGAGMICECFSLAP